VFAVYKGRGSSQAGGLTGFLILMLIIFQSSFAHAADKLIIKSIKAQKTAHGLDSSSKTGFAALGAAIGVAAASAAAPATAGLSTFAAIKAGGSGGGAALAAANLLDGKYSGQDDLIVRVNGRKVWPIGVGFQPMNPGEEIFPNIEASFEFGVRIQLVEYDSGSDDDDLGALDISSTFYDLTDPGADYGKDQVIVLSPSDEDGSIYLITYVVLRNQGDPSQVIKSMICGTAQCNACFNAACVGQQISHLDRDGDLEDLKSCPYPFVTTGFQKFPQFIVDDVYLRVCGTPCPVLAPTTLTASLPSPGRPLITWSPISEADRYLVTEKNQFGQVTNSFSTFEPRFSRTHSKAPTFNPGTYTYSVIGMNIDSIVASRSNGTEGVCLGGASESVSIFVPLTPVLVDVEVESEDAVGLGTGAVDLSPEPVTEIGGKYYTPGQVVTFTAKAESRSEFVGWSGNPLCSDDKLTCNITIVTGAPVNVKAVFRPKPRLVIYTVGISNAADGVNVLPKGNVCNNVAYTCFEYDTGDAVSIAGITDANTGVAFDRWSGDEDCSDGSVTVDKNITCTAVFKRTSYDLTITPSAGSKVISDTGSIDCGELCSASYPVDDSSFKVVELLTATINPGFTFVRWVGASGCWDANTLINVNDPLRRSVAVGDKDVNCGVIAVPEDTVYALTIEKLGGGTVKAAATPFVDSSDILICPAGHACTVEYPVNAQVTLTAKATRGSEFVGFESSDVGSDNYRREDDDCIDGQISMIESLSCVATFKTNILVVNGADDDKSKEDNEYIGVLNNMDSVDYDIWHIKHPTSGDNTFDTTTNQRRVEPSAEDLANYGRVIWYTGNAGTERAVASLKAGPSEAAEASLASYLDSGGCLLMSGPEYFKDRGLTPFMKNYLGVSGITEDVEASYIKGAGDAIFGFDTLTEESFKGASSEGYFRFQGSFPPYSSDALIPNPDIADGNILFTYQDDDFGNIRSRGDAAIAIDTGTYRAAFFGFPFLGISSGERQNNTMRTFLDFCGRPENDDTFEVNDDFDSASERKGSFILDNMKVFKGNDDYFKWTSDFYGQGTLVLQFDNSEDTFGIEIYDSQFSSLHQTEFTTSTTFPLTNLDEDDIFYIRIYGVDQATGEYSLTISYIGAPDRDHDGTPDSEDALPEDAFEQFDNDGDFIGDTVDTDDDNDGLPDLWEIQFGFDPLVANDEDADTDADTFTDLQEFRLDTNSNDASSFPVPAALPVSVSINQRKNDVDGDGKSDLLWRSEAKGWNFLWSMDGVQTKQARPINVVQDDGWLMAGQGDYDADGKSDILWRNTLTGMNFIYLMDGLTIKTRKVLNFVDAPQWELRGSGDFNGDGKGDVLWRDVVRGRTHFFLMDGLSIGTNQPGLLVTDLNYKIVAIGDINGDGTDDVIWRNQATGVNYIWIMVNGQIASRYVLNTINGDWTIAGAGDLDGDGTDDIILRNQVDGRNWAYLMEDGQIKASELINTVGDTNWQIANMGDYDGDGKVDILWRNENAARNIVHLMDGLSVHAKGVLRPTDNTWQLAQ
jgi:hypothetical protein